MSLRKIYYWLPPSLRLWARKVVYFPSDIISRKTYPNGLPVPPKSLIFTGGGDFMSTGFRFLDLFKTYGNITPQSNILDIGSGMGRMAMPLTHFLDLDGSYLGIDIMENAVNWCEKNISSSFPRFKFQYLPLKNDLYRNDGSDPSEFQINTSDQTFDFTYLISVFTHMLPDEIDHYLGEISRTLKTNGRALITFFVFDNQEELTNNAFEKFIIQDEHFALMDEKVKGANVAFSKSYLESLFDRHQMSLVHYDSGKWKGNTDALDFQDVIILEKQ